MAAFQFIHEWKKTMCMGANLSTDAFLMYLSNDLPVPGTDVNKADIAPITEQNGYAEFALTTSWVETGAGTGVWSFRNNADKTWTAAGGSFGAFQYVVIVDDTLASDPLVGFWDVGAATTITVGNSFLVDLDSDFSIFDLS
jgi:hypothetical protein